MIRRLLIVLAVLWACWYLLDSAAKGATTKLWSPLNVQSTVTMRALAPFSQVTAWPWQASGASVWTYVKGSRSHVATYPEAWYVHQDGARVVDPVFHAYVMDPASPGWQAHVIHECPARCYIDGLGTTSLGRAHLHWSDAEWVSRVAQLLHAVVDSGRSVVPNSMGLASLAYLPITGHASTEAWRRNDTATWRILDGGHVWVEAHEGKCGRKLAAYLLARAPGDLFHCRAVGSVVTTVPAVLGGRPVGAALGARTRVSGGWRRAFRHAVLTVNDDGSYQLQRRTR